MSRAAHRNGRGAVVLLLSALLLLGGALAGPQGHVAHPVSHADLHRTADLDMGTLAVAQSYPASHLQRSDGQSIGMLPTHHESTNSCSAMPNSPRMALPVSGSCWIALRGRAPPA